MGASTPTFKNRGCCSTHTNEDPAYPWAIEWIYFQHFILNYLVLHAVSTDLGELITYLENADTPRASGALEYLNRCSDVINPGDL